MLIPALSCSACGLQVTLPFHHYENSNLVEPYWPEQESRLCWICDRCKHSTLFSKDEIGWTTVADDYLKRSDESFWRVQLLCDHATCPYRIIAHVRTFGMTSAHLLGNLLTVADPVLTCRLGHKTVEKMYPCEIDYVEWIGDFAYLT